MLFDTSYKYVSLLSVALESTCYMFIIDHIDIHFLFSKKLYDDMLLSVIQGSCLYVIYNTSHATWHDFFAAYHSCSLLKYHPQGMAIPSIELSIVDFFFDDWAFFCSKIEHWSKGVGFGEGLLTCATTLDDSKAKYTGPFQTKVYTPWMLKYVSPLSHDNYKWAPRECVTWQNCCN